MDNHNNSNGEGIQNRRLSLNLNRIKKGSLLSQCKNMLMNNSITR